MLSHRFLRKTGAHFFTRCSIRIDSSQSKLRCLKVSHETGNRAANAPAAVAPWKTGLSDNETRYEIWPALRRHGIGSFGSDLCRPGQSGSGQACCGSSIHIADSCGINPRRSNGCPKALGQRIGCCPRPIGVAWHAGPGSAASACARSGDELVAARCPRAARYHQHDR